MNLMTKVMSAKPTEQRQVYGECEWTLTPVRFFKGDDGRWELVQTSDDDQDADVEIVINIYPLRGDFEISRKMLAGSTRNPDWSKVVLPSLQRLGINDLAQIYRKYVQIEMVKSGTYTGKDGERKDRTAIRFLKVFKSRAECEAAAAEHFSPSNGHSNGPSNGNGNGHSNGNPLRDFALQSLPALWRASGEDYKRFRVMFGENPTYAQVGLTLDSPEVVAIVGDDLPF